MRWLIDGYNVIGRDVGLTGDDARGLEPRRRALHARMIAAAQRTGDVFVVVFDGEARNQPAPAQGQIEIVFSRPPEKADDVLMRLDPMGPPQLGERFDGERGAGGHGDHPRVVHPRVERDVNPADHDLFGGRGGGEGAVEYRVGRDGLPPPRIRRSR